MRVERTLIALGLVLALAGLIFAYNGYIYVNVDRGPPMMVSGVLVFGFGLVIAALGFALRELQAISADASKVALLLAKNRSVAFPAEIAPKSAPLPKPPPLAPFETPDAAPSGVAADVAQPDLSPHEDKSEKPRGSLFSRKRPEDRAGPGSLAISPLSWMKKPDPADESPVKPEDDWLNLAIAVEADTAAREEPAAGQQTFGSQPGDDESPAEPPPKPDVMGRYEAHGAHYTMFADGSIEAETQHGLYRFANIEELKRFIEGEDSADVTAKG